MHLLLPQLCRLFLALVAFGAMLQGIYVNTLLFLSDSNVNFLPI